MGIVKEMERLSCEACRAGQIGSLRGKKEDGFLKTVPVKNTTKSKKGE